MQDTTPSADARIERALTLIRDVRAGDATLPAPKTLGRAIEEILTPAPKRHVFGGVTFEGAGRFTPGVGEWGLVDGVPALRESAETDPYHAQAWINVPILRPVDDSAELRAALELIVSHGEAWSQEIARKALGGAS